MAAVPLTAPSMTRTSNHRHRPSVEAALIGCTIVGVVELVHVVLVQQKPIHARELARGVVCNRAPLQPDVRRDARSRRRRSLRRRPSASARARHRPPSAAEPSAAAPASALAPRTGRDGRGKRRLQPRVEARCVRRSRAGCRRHPPATEPIASTISAKRHRRRRVMQVAIVHRARAMGSPHARANLHVSVRGLCVGRAGASCRRSPWNVRKTSRNM